MDMFKKDGEKMKKEKILGIQVSVTTYEELKNSVEKDILNHQKSFIVAINPEKVLKARKDEQLKELLNKATYQIPDGVGIIYASKIKKGQIRSRITGIDCMDMLCDLASEKGYKIFLYGAKEETIKETKVKLEEKYPKINIVGYINGYEKDNEKIIKEINKSKADIVFVALGSPKQENWINDYKDEMNAAIFQGVGGSFDVISGNIKRAPLWMQKAGLEWLYRLIKEPKRIFRQLKLVKFLFLILFSKKEI